MEVQNLRPSYWKFLLRLTKGRWVLMENLIDYQVPLCIWIVEHTKLWFLCPGLLWWTEKCLMFSGPRLPDSLVTTRLNLTPDTCCVPSTWTCSWADRPVDTCEMSSHRPTMTRRHGNLLHTISLSYILSAWRSLNVKWKCKGSYTFTLMWIWNILQCNYRRQDVTSLVAHYKHLKMIWGL